MRTATAAFTRHDFDGLLVEHDPIDLRVPRLETPRGIAVLREHAVEKPRFVSEALDEPDPTKRDDAAIDQCRLAGIGSSRVNRPHLRDLDAHAGMSFDVALEMAAVVARMYP